MLIVPVLQQRNQSPWGDPPILQGGTEASIPLSLLHSLFNSQDERAIP